jgi:phospholipid/cholesterol/gamma-HCH transport system substrate-binding protein
VTVTGRSRRLTAACLCIALTSVGCGFEGVNSLSLPGAVGRGPDASTYHLSFANIGTLESNSPVLIDDVVVGSVGRMTFSNWHIDVEVSVRPDVVVPANAVASVGQTSLLGSMHVALDPPIGEAPMGRLRPGATIGIDDTASYPSTEQTLSSLSAVVTGGGLGQLGDIIHNLTAALSGRQDDVRDLLTRLDTFIGTLDRQRDDIIASIQALNRLAVTLADQRDVISEALVKIPPALDVLIRERPRITTALDKLRVFSDTATGLVNDTQADLVTNLQNLEPTLRSLADVGKNLDTALAYTTVFPFGQNIIDRGVRGDYINFFGELDFTVPRLKRSLLLGSRWGDEHATLVPAPGEPYNQRYTYDPLGLPVAPPPPGGPLGAVPGNPPTPQLDADPPGAQVFPVKPPPAYDDSQPLPAPGSPARVFAGPYGSPAVEPTQGGG